MENKFKGKTPQEIYEYHRNIGRKRVAHRAPSGPRTPEFNAKVAAGHKRVQAHVDMVADYLAQQGYTVFRVDHVAQPDLLAKKDGNVYAIEVEEGNRLPDVTKYQDQSFFDEIIWVALNDKAERKFGYVGITPLRLNLPDPEAGTDAPR